jgi:hypothetical protein
MVRHHEDWGGSACPLIRVLCLHIYDVFTHTPSCEMHIHRICIYATYLTVRGWVYDHLVAGHGRVCSLAQGKMPSWSAGITALGKHLRGGESAFDS